MHTERYQVVPLVTYTTTGSFDMNIPNLDEVASLSLYFNDGYHCQRQTTIVQINSVQEVHLSVLKKVSTVCAGILIHLSSLFDAIFQRGTPHPPRTSNFHVRPWPRCVTQASRRDPAKL